MRITILQGAFLPVPPLRGGAVEKLWLELGKQFAILGHDVVHISRTYPGLPRHQTIDGVRHLRVSGFDMPACGLLLKTYDLIYTIRALFVLPPADILITNTFWAPILIRYPTPFGHIVVSVERMPKGQTLFYRHVSLLRSCSSAVRDRILLEQPSLFSKTVVVPNSLPFSLPHNYIPISKKPVILYCGRIHPEKGLELLIQAFAFACNHGLVGWTLRIVGPCDVLAGGGGATWLRSLQQIASSVAGSIVWTGPIYDDQQLLAEYSQASLFVYPSLAEHGEAMPLAPLEAMAHGAVPIVSDLASFKDYIFDGINGLVFNHRSTSPVQSLAASIYTLASDPIRRRALSEAASSVRQTHDSAAIADRFLSIFSSLIKEFHSVSSAR